MTDEQIIQLLKSGKQTAALKMLYSYYPAIRQMILQNNGNKHDAEDIFQESLIIFCRKIKEENFTLTASLKTFLYSISRLQWLNELRKRKKELLKDEVQASTEAETNELKIGRASCRERV